MRNDWEEITKNGDQSLKNPEVNENDLFGEYRAIAKRIMLERFGEKLGELDTLYSTELSICEALMGKVEGLAPAEFYDCYIEDALLRAEDRIDEAIHTERWCTQNEGNMPTH